MRVLGTQDEFPLVSCTMPTRNRRIYAQRALAYFLGQDYPNRELIIVDDGDDSIADIVPSDPSIRYFRPPGVRTLGAKRNIACDESRGVFIAHWDDDDWMCRTRLSTQVSRLLASGKELTAPATLLHFDPEKGQAFRRTLAADGTLPRGPVLYRKGVWRNHPYSEKNVGEEHPVARALFPDRVHFEEDDRYYLKVVHSGSTAPRNYRDPAWSVAPVAEAIRRLENDAHYYNRPATGPAGTSAQKISPISVGAPFAVYDGYGSLSEYVVTSLVQAGAQVNVFPFNLDRRGFPPELLALIDAAPPQPTSPALCYTWPLGDFSRFYRLGDVFISTMWETSQLPAGWAAKINWARAIIVPTRFNADMFRSSGVTPPVEVVPAGINPAVYNYIERPDRPGITTLIVGTFVPRKNIEIGIASWKLAFAGDPEARLIIKTRFGVTPYVPDDPRILFVDSEETTHGISHWYSQADVLLALGNEGFGLPLVEGMATGMPVIALSTEGQGDVVADAKGLVLDVGADRWVPFNYPPFGDCGVRGVPSVEAVSRRLRWVAEHRDEAKAIGRAASEWAVQNRSVWNMGPATLDVIERRARTPRRLRRTASLVIGPELIGTEAGYAVEALALACGQPVHTIPGQPASALLHFTYVAGLTDEVAFASAVRAARRRGQAVCVAEFALAPHATAWELDASLLIAHTQQGVDLLRKRWPGKRVELLPLGCPPPDTPAAGDRIAIWRGIEESELCGIDRKAILWLDHDNINGIRRPNSGIGAIVLWQNTTALPQSSYMARICISSGIPVIASKGLQFVDVDEVILRPARLAEIIDEVLQNENLRNSIGNSARKFCEDWSHQRVAKLAIALWQSV